MFRGKLEYVKIFSAILSGLIPLIFIFAYGFNGSAGSARYLLSAIGQSLAAIVALSFTVPLIAMQLVGSKYGIKVYDVYFDKDTRSFMLLAIISTIFPFVVLSQIYEPDTGPLTYSNSVYVTGSLSLLVLTLLGLPILILDLKEKLKPEYIIKSYTKEIESFISKGDLNSAHERVNTLKSIGIAAARERDDVIFGDFLAAWLDLLVFDKVTWIRNVLINSLPDIFKVAATEDETVAERGLDKLKAVIFNLAAKKELKKSKEIIGLFPRIINPLIRIKPKVAKYSLDNLKDTAQLSAGILGPNEATEISVGVIEALADIGKEAAKVDPELGKKSITDIADIVDQNIYKKEIVEKGIVNIIKFKGFYIEGVFPLFGVEFPREIERYANIKLLMILDSISTGHIRYINFPEIGYRIEIANLIVRFVDVYNLDEARELAFIAATFLGDEKKAKKLLKRMAEIIKEANVGDIRTSPVPWGTTVEKVPTKKSAKTFRSNFDGFYEKYLA